MTDTVDLLGKPPIMRPFPKLESIFDEDWKGEHRILHVRLFRQGPEGRYGQRTKRPKATRAA